MRSNPAPVRVPPRESCNLAHRLGGDHRDAGLIEDAMVQLHHLHRSPVKTSDLRSQGISEKRHLLAVRCANMRRELLLSTVLKAEWRKPEKVRKLACCEPRE